MDHMDYGLSEPKLALMKDGGVFVAGQIQAPMEAPAVPQTMRWDPEAKVFRSVSGDFAGTILMVGSAMLGTEASVTARISSVTINQGVTRYLKMYDANVTLDPNIIDPNTFDGTPSPIVWKPEVPLVSARKARIKGTVIFQRRVKGTIHFELRFVDDAGVSMEAAIPVDVEAGNTLGSAEVSFQKDLDPGQVLAGSHLQVYVLNGSGGLINDLAFKAIPKFQAPQPLVVYVYPVNFLDATGTSVPFDFASAVQDLKRDLLRYFPLSEGGIFVIPRTWNAGVTPPTWDGRSTGDGPMLSPTNWDTFVRRFTDQVWAQHYVTNLVTDPPDFHMALFPPISGLTSPGSELGVNGITRDIGEHFALAHNQAYSNTNTQFFAVHELGHAFGQPHAPGPGTAGGTDPNWPYTLDPATGAAYKDAMLGIEGWDAFLNYVHTPAPNRTASTATDKALQTERDFMTHPSGNPSGSASGQQKPNRYWVSDYTFKCLFRPLP
jgi:hypothetical protein